MAKHKFYSTCIGWPRHDVRREGGLEDMIDVEREITRRTFLSHVDSEYMRQLERDIGYATHYKHGLTMASDYYVSYHRSKLHGRTVYYFRWSATEYVFVPHDYASAA